MQSLHIGIVVYPARLAGLTCWPPSRPEVLSGYILDVSQPPEDYSHRNKEEMLGIETFFLFLPLLFLSPMCTT